MSYEVVDVTDPGWTDEWKLTKDISILFYADTGEVRFHHLCDRWATGRGIIICAPLLQLAHAIDNDTKTITPSVMCTDCGTHGFVTNGSWNAC